MNGSQVSLRETKSFDWCLHGSHGAYLLKKSLLGISPVRSLLHSLLRGVRRDSPSPNIDNYLM